MHALEADGFAIVEGALSTREVQDLLRAVETLPALDDLRGGVRDLFTTLPLTRDLAGHPAVRRWPAAVLGPGAFAVRAILFDKTPGANWKVAWHQDVTIPTMEPREVAGFGPWTLKAGIPHVQPPASVLEGMLTVRIHLDDCALGNGPVRCLPGSHRHGRLTPEQVDAWRERVAPVATPCPAGGLLLMRPLTLHASSPATDPGHRRVIHLEYAAAPLPGGLQWRECWGGPGDRAA